MKIYIKILIFLAVIALAIALPDNNNGSGTVSTDIPPLRLARKQIICPPTKDEIERYACPTPGKRGRYRCIDYQFLCDNYIDCPNGEDEDRKACMFYKMPKVHMDELAYTITRYTDNRGGIAPS